MKTLLCLFYSIIFANAALAGADGTPLPHELAGQTQRASHGMIVFGKDTVYLYHLPMWHGVHAWQIVLEATLDDAALAAYDQDRAAGSTLNSFAPAPFALANVKPGFQIDGQLLHGHFEQGGTPLAPATATVKSIVMIVPLAGIVPGPATAPKTFAFGHDGEQYTAHVATNRPDFDQVLSGDSTVYFSTSDLGL
jgi:hypothetical protein